MDFPVDLLCTFAIALASFLVLMLTSIRVVPEYQRLVVFRLGRCIGTRGPGLVLLMPVVDKASVVDIREHMRSIESAAIPTRDGSSVSTKLDYYFKVTDPQLSVLAPVATDSAVETAIRDELETAIRSQVLQDVLQDKQLADDIRTQLRTKSRAWGIEITRIEARDIREVNKAKD